MGKKDVVVTAVAAILGILSAVLGFAAEVKRVKAEDVKVIPATLICDYPNSPAGALGLAAAVTLVLAQIVIHAFSGCLCCKRRAPAAGRTWRNAWIVFVFSWITFIIGLIMLLSAAALNRRGDRRSEGILTRYCYVVRPGISAGGAALALASVFLGIVYYHSVATLKMAAEGHEAQQGPGIAMAQPQFATQPPVFVHEDTYNRRQIP